MPVFHQADAVPYETHGSRFRSYVAPSRGSEQLCAWQLTVPPPTCAASRTAPAGKRSCSSSSANCT